MTSVPPVLDKPYIDPKEDIPTSEQAEDQLDQVAVKAFGEYVEQAEIDQQLMKTKKISLFKRTWIWIKRSFSSITTRISTLFKKIFNKKSKPTLKAEVEPSVDSKENDEYDPETLSDFVDDIFQESKSLKKEIKKIKFEKLNGIHFLKCLSFEVHENINMLRETIYQNKEGFPKLTIESLRDSLERYETAAELLREKVSENKDEILKLFLEIQDKIEIHPLVQLEDLDWSDIEQYIAYYNCIKMYEKELGFDKLPQNPLDRTDKMLIEQLLKQKLEAVAQKHAPKKFKDLRDLAAFSDENYPVKGIGNIGSSCYINSATQCLLHSPVFLNLLIQPLKKLEVYVNGAKQLEFDHDFKERQEIVHACKAVLHFYKAGNQNDLILAMKRLRSLAFSTIIGKECGFIEGKKRSQEDTEKFIRFVLRAVDYSFNSQRVRKGQHEKIVGEYVSRAAIEPFQIVEVAMKPEILGIQELIDDTFQEQEIIYPEGPFQMWVDEGMLTTERWKEKTNLLSPPPFLPIRLKRFRFEGDEQKITTPIEIGDGTIDLRHAVNSEEPILYRLRGAAVHRGGTIGDGHYISYTRSVGEDKWYYTSDHTVQPVETEDEVLTLCKEAYVLFYERI